MVLKLRKKGFKRAYIIKHGLVEMKKVGFIWVSRKGEMFRAGPDGKLKKMK